ncbi:uncharacterized protein LOC130782343 [Actinidia eriantha]|uniref:uncharacterized protein LOC130782343 n=1 Tax=Actinidia eriantha TaxID=165200 RepID=UPI00258C6288|nr:uncharacterized protein LOC130782343 [Actinidia eriantha]
MEFKHFSHPHGLSLHQAPQGPETRCSGCHSPASAGTSLYSCWQCKFFLHEQCFHATRSLNHPSHPPHPLTLIPYPTYPSGSFFCNSCSLTGTGFSYSCSTCEFDLHVHCAYTPLTTAVHDLYPNFPNQNFTAHDPYPNFPNQNFYSFPQEPPNISFSPQFDSKLQTSTTHDDPYGVNVNFPNPQYSYPNELPVPKFNPQMGYTGEEFSSVANNKPTGGSYGGENRTFPEIAAQESVVSGPEPYSVPNEGLPKNYGVQTGLPTEKLPQASLVKPQNLKHFSHQHALQFSEDLKEEDRVLCSGCEQHLFGSAYSCTEPSCNFHLHKSCIELPQEIHHKSHPKHALTLLPTLPYEEHNEFTCNACDRTGTAFTYHCKDCKFDLHVKCATNLPDTVKRFSHEHPLTLLYSSPYKKTKHGTDEDEEVVYFRCDTCLGKLDENCWVYYCQKCDYGTDVHCAIVEDSDNDEEESGEYSELNTLMAAQMKQQQHMQRIQIQMQMSRQNAQFMASLSHSFANLV